MKLSKYFVLIACFVFCSCNASKQILYLQDVNTDVPQEIPDVANLTVRQGDIISIIVNSQTAEFMAQFNLPRSNAYIGNVGISSYSNGQVSGYTVDESGCIDFPVIGKFRVVGMTRQQIAEAIQKTLKDNNLVADAVVTVDFLNLHINVLGEVNKPGEIRIDRDKMTLLEALSLAGDLTIYGKRDDVLVVRENNNERRNYYVDLRSRDLFSSPAYYLQQNDLVYVKPNAVRAGQSTVNGNSVKSVSLWLTISSFVTSLATLLFR